MCSLSVYFVSVNPCWHYLYRTVTCSISISLAFLQQKCLHWRVLAHLYITSLDVPRYLKSISLQPLLCYTLTISHGLSQLLVSVSVAGPCHSVPGVPRSDTVVLVLMFVKLCMIYLDLIRAACSWSPCTCCAPLMFSCWPTLVFRLPYVTPTASSETSLWYLHQ